MNYTPGTSQAYSHSESVILGQVIEHATGQTKKELYETNILGRKGLADTQFRHRPGDSGTRAPRLRPGSRHLRGCDLLQPVLGLGDRGAHFSGPFISSNRLSIMSLPVVGLISSTTGGAQGCFATPF